jgi:hypothetical protein
MLLKLSNVRDRRDAFGKLCSGHEYFVDFTLAQE